MTYGFQHRCECGCNRYHALTGEMDDTTVEALECVNCESVKEV